MKSLIFLFVVLFQLPLLAAVGGGGFVIISPGQSGGTNVVASATNAVTQIQRHGSVVGNNITNLNFTNFYGLDLDATAAGQTVTIGVSAPNALTNNDTRGVVLKTSLAISNATIGRFIWTLDPGLTLSGPNSDSYRFDDGDIIAKRFYGSGASANGDFIGNGQGLTNVYGTNIVLATINSNKIDAATHALYVAGGLPTNSVTGIATNGTAVLSTYTTNINFQTHDGNSITGGVANTTVTIGIPSRNLNALTNNESRAVVMQTSLAISNASIGRFIWTLDPGLTLSGPNSDSYRFDDGDIIAKRFFGAGTSANGDFIGNGQSITNIYGTNIVNTTINASKMDDATHALYIAANYQLSSLTRTTNINFAYQLISLSTNANFNATVSNTRSNLVLTATYTNTSLSWITGTLSQSATRIGGPTGVVATAFAIAPTNVAEIRFWTDANTNLYMVYETGIPSLALDSIAAETYSPGDSISWDPTLGFTNRPYIAGSGTVTTVQTNNGTVTATASAIDFASGADLLFSGNLNGSTATIGATVTNSSGTGALLRQTNSSASGLTLNGTTTNSGNVRFTADNTHSIGGDGENRPANIIAGTVVSSPLFYAQTVIATNGYRVSTNSWSGPTNILYMTNEVQYYVASGNIAVTNIFETGAQDTRFVNLIISNSTAGVITGFVTHANAKALGSGTTNALTIPAAKVGDFWFRTFARYRTNYVTAVEQ